MGADDILAKAAAELARLDEEVRAIEAKRKKLHGFIDTYKELTGAGLGVYEPRVMQQAVVTTVPAISKTTAKATILTAVTEVLQDGKPHRTADLLDELGRRGVEVGGQDREQALSAVLSKSKQFRADRKAGWTRKENPSDASTSEGPDA